MRPYAKWHPYPPNSDELIKELRYYGWLQHVLERARSQSRTRNRSQSHGRTSVSNEIYVPGLPEALTLAQVNRDYSPPKGEDDKLTLEAEYHDLPPHANNFTNAEILACVAHRIRALHGAEPPDINIYHAPRAIYENSLKDSSNMTE